MKTGIMSYNKNGQIECRRAVFDEKEKKLTIDTYPFLTTDRPEKPDSEYPIKHELFKLNGMHFDPIGAVPGDSVSIKVKNVIYSGRLVETQEYFCDGNIKRYLYPLISHGKFEPNVSFHKSWSSKESLKKIKEGSYVHSDRHNKLFEAELHGDIVFVKNVKYTVTYAMACEQAKNPTMWPTSGRVWKGPEPFWNPPVAPGNIFSFSFSRNNVKYVAKCVSFADPEKVFITPDLNQVVFDKLTFVLDVDECQDKTVLCDFVLNEDASFVPQVDVNE